MAADPAVWITDLIRTRWDSAVQSVQGDGETLPTPIPKPTFSKASDQGVAAFRINNSTLIKVYSGGDRTTKPGSWGYTDVDEDSEWIVAVFTDGPNAREQAHAIATIIERVLELYRVDPGGDWQLVDGWRTNTVDDFPASQHWTVAFHLSRRGRVLKTAVHSPNQ